MDDDISCQYCSTTDFLSEIILTTYIFSPNFYIWLSHLWRSYSNPRAKHLYYLYRHCRVCVCLSELFLPFPSFCISTHVQRYIFSKSPGFPPGRQCLVQYLTTSQGALAQLLVYVRWPIRQDSDFVMWPIWQDSDYVRWPIWQDSDYVMWLLINFWTPNQKQWPLSTL